MRTYQRQMDQDSIDTAALQIDTVNLREEFIKRAT